MSIEAGTRQADSNPAIRNYLFACMAAMFVLLLLLLRRGMDTTWSLTPVLVGILGAAFRVRSAPVLVLLTMAGAFYARQVVQLINNIAFALALSPNFELPHGESLRQGPGGGIPDWLLSVALLAYVAAHYRLVGLSVAYFPEPGRNRKQHAAGFSGSDACSAGDVNVRSTDAVSSSEMSWFLLSLPAWALLAQVLWKLVPTGSRPGQPESTTLHAIVFAWVLGLGWFLIAGLMSYAIWQRRPPQQMTMFLRDAVWREMYREQRRLNQERAWARLRRRKERK